MSASNNDTIYSCPKCGSKENTASMKRTFNVMTAQVRCTSCGYGGVVQRFAR